MEMNPELRRSLWLEITPTRMAGMPMVLLAAICMAWLGDDQSLGSAVKNTSLALFVAITYLWGMRQTSDSVLGEIKERTWDWQRMSAIGPWSLAWGKFLGSTVYVWYGGAICLPFMVFSWGGSSWVHTLKAVAALVLGALLTQGIGLLMSLQMLTRDRAVSRSESSALVVLAFFIASPFLSIVGSKGSIVVWYGHPFGHLDFTLFSLAAFVFWTLVGCYNMVRAEFRMRALPYAWGGFVLFLMLYVSGFAAGVSAKIGVAGMTAAALTYLMALLEKKDPVAMGRLLQWWREGQSRRVMEGLPCWIVILPFVLASAALLAVMPGDIAATAGGLGSRALIVAAIAFLVRDIGLLLYLNLAKKPQRADMFMILCLALLYGLFPGVLEMLGATSATAVFWPRHSHWGISLAASVLGAVGAWKLVVIRWRRLSAGD